MTQNTANDAAQPRKLRIKYEEYSARYANQTILSGSTDEVFLDFSSGPVPDAATGESLVPIHTRIAMSHAGARRLLTALQQTLKRIEASSVKTATAQRATLPSVKG
ncbi:MAG: DUF3467 domain-containing protein [Rariglobus sp.]